MPSATVFDNLIAALKLDGHMTPQNEPRDPESHNDYGVWFQEETEGWEQTDHFEVCYGSKLRDMAHDLTDDDVFGKDVWLGHYEDLKEEFWERWADIHHADKFWRDNVKIEPTVVIFRVWDDDVLALFPELPADIQGKYCTSYQHVGQHGQADYDHCIYKSRPAKPDEYAELAAELKRAGYKLDIKRRATYKMHQKRWKTAREQDKAIRDQGKKS